MSSQGDRKKFKEWYDRALLADIASRFAAVYPKFEAARFKTLAGERLEELEMMDRVRQIANALAATLPGPTAHSMELVIATMGTPFPIDSQGEEIVATGYWLWPIGEFIGRTGLDDWEASWQAMIELTQRLTSEFAIRPFLAADLDACLERLEALLDHPSHHVRRWISEGTRTRLPWAKAVPVLKKAQSRRLELLEALKDDESLYVRRSVANHLQDVLKDDQEAGLDVLERWSSLALPRVDWVVKHAARGLLKAGHPRVLALYGLHREITMKEFTVSPEFISIAGLATLETKLWHSGQDSVPVRVDYRWEGPTPGGRRFSKVFRWTDITLGAGAEVVITKAHPFLERSTRRLPSGDYSFELLVNGRSLAKREVVLRP